MAICDKCKRSYYYHVFISKKKYNGINRCCFECVRTKEQPNGTKFIPWKK